MTSTVLNRPLCVVIAGPNGAGNTTFAREFLLRDAGIIHFVNTDLIAQGLSPLRPEIASVAAGRLFLREIDRLAATRQDFAFETTLSGRGYVRRIRAWIAEGYRVEIVFLRLESVRLAIERVARRVRQGGHDVPAIDIRRRFRRGWMNFQTIYRPLASGWGVWDNSGPAPVLCKTGP